MPSILKKILLSVVIFVAPVPCALAVDYSGEFAPSPPLIEAGERPYRDAVSPNGSWQFQPVAVPAGFINGQGTPPDLTPPSDAGWERTPIKIPSPWNVNTWGAGRHTGEGTAKPYWPDSVYYPSYPESWDNVKMGWLRRDFTVPQTWQGRRVILHFEAVAGECEVRVNGKSAGSHFDKYLPFDLDVTDLVSFGAANQLLVGVRSHELFNKQSKTFAKMSAPYPTGSETARLAGIWQDVSLKALPSVRVSDVFVKPRVKEGMLELTVSVRNDSNGPKTMGLGGDVSPWINLAGTDTANAPVPAGQYGAPLLEIPSRDLTIAAGGVAEIEIRVPVGEKLKTWAPGAPNLHGVHLSVRTEGKVVDASTTRFGWREFEIQGKDLMLNGKKIQLVGDLLHPFGPLIMSRRHVWAWYRFVQDFGGNAVRPHAQIYPRHYMDLADEMGIVVLDETAIFGSSVALNFAEPVAWERFEKHYDGLVLRDRNHPSVFGWSFGNELFAIFQLNHVPPDKGNEWYAKLVALGKRAHKLDPTRQWISCDGDEDLGGRLPVWSRHFGHAARADALPEIDKPLMVGEAGGSYYARPSQLKMFNGERAYENYQGRSEALAIDVYDNIVNIARPHLAYFSASETAWFGAEHLNYGYRDFKRLPSKADGVVFSKPYQEGKPGMQIERIPPYVDTLNPGWDPELPLYKPLPMFEAVKQAFSQPGPAASPWSRRNIPTETAATPVSPAIESVGFIGEKSDPLCRRLMDLGLPISETPRNFTIIDGDGKQANDAAAVMDKVKSQGGVAMLMLGEGRSANLPSGIELTARQATALVANASHPWTASLKLSDLYFAEDGADRFIVRHGIGGRLPEDSKILLQASNTDWSLFNEAPEVAKCAAVVLYEKLVKPAGAALVEIPWGKGKLVISSLDYRIETSAADAMWRTLFTRAGVKVGEPAGRGIAAFDREGVLVDALGAGRFAAVDVATAMAKDFVGGKSIEPLTGYRAGEVIWQPVNCPSRDRFMLGELKQSGVEQGAFASYFSFWIRSPRALDNLLADGPDAPNFSIHCYVSSDCSLVVNGMPLEAARVEKADYRKLVTFGGIALKKGWNHCLIKVASDSLRGAEPGTLAVRISSSHPEFLRQLDSAIERKKED